MRIFAYSLIMWRFNMHNMKIMCIFSPIFYFNSELSSDATSTATILYISINNIHLIILYSFDYFLWFFLPLYNLLSYRSKSNHVDWLGSQSNTGCIYDVWGIREQISFLVHFQISRGASKLAKCIEWIFFVFCMENYYESPSRLYISRDK